MWQLIRGEPDTVIRLFRPLLLTAMIGGYVAAQFDLPGINSFVFMGTLGAAGGSLVQYRNERGLWMFAGLFLLFWGGIYLLITLASFWDIMRNAQQPPISLTVDFTIATILLSTNIRFLFRVARINWALSREPLDT